MDHQMLQQRFAALTTAHLADACIRAQVPVRCASSLLRAVAPGSRLAGRVCPARHAGSIDASRKAFETAAPGDMLVVDNGGLLDEACVGDLVALEAHAAERLDPGGRLWGALVKDGVGDLPEIVIDMVDVHDLHHTDLRQAQEAAGALPNPLRAM